jgi:diketogulonate reductase-like aldo/keto reductase
MSLTVTANGAEIPALGLGTWDLRGSVCEAQVAGALDMGYRHIDTAAMYDNEAEVGAGIRASSVPRDDIFLTTKVWPDDAADGDCQRSVEASLARFGLDYVDLILLHWPNPRVPVAETMGALGDVKRRGLARHIGVSNFNVELLREAVATSDEPVVVNQVEYHPFLDQSALLAECRGQGIALTAYSPLAKGRVFSDPVLREIASRHGKNAGQVALRWLVQQQGVAAIPRSGKRERVAEFFDIEDFALSGDEMQRIGALAGPGGRLVNLSWAPDWD